MLMLNLLCCSLLLPLLTLPELIQAEPKRFIGPPGIAWHRSLAREIEPCESNLPRFGPPSLSMGYLSLSLWARTGSWLEMGRSRAMRVAGFGASEPGED